MSEGEMTILIDEIFPSDRSRLASLPRDLGRARSLCPMTDETFHNLLLILTEGVTNAIVHGNGDDPSRNVRLFVACRRQSIVCYIEDEGPGFDIDDVADPVAPENLLREGGRGLYIIRELSESFRVTVTPTGTSLRIALSRG